MPDHLTTQVDRAIETEINTGPARRPRSASADAGGAVSTAAAAIAGNGSAVPPPPVPAAGAAATEDDEYDPLEAFMAEVNQEVAANKPNKPAGLQEVQQCDDVADPATEYMEVWLQATFSAHTVSCACHGCDQLASFFNAKLCHRQVACHISCCCLEIGSSRPILAKSAGYLSWLLR